MTRERRTVLVYGDLEFRVGVDPASRHVIATCRGCAAEFRWLHGLPKDVDAAMLAHRCPPAAEAS